MRYVFSVFPSLYRLTTRTWKTTTLSVLLIATLMLHGYIYVSQDGHAPVEYSSARIAAATPVAVAETVGQSMRPVSIRIADETVDVPFDELGITVDERDVARQAEAAWGWRNYVPVVGTKHLLTPVMITPAYVVDDARLAETVVRIAQELSTDPVDAELAITDDAVEVTKSQEGRSVSSEDVYDVVQQAVSDGRLDLPLVVSTQPIPPRITETELQKTADKYDGIANQTLTIVVDDTVFTLDSSEVLQLLRVEPDAVTLDTGTLDEFVSAWSEEVAVTPGVTQQEYVDDALVSTTPGVYGKRLDRDALEAALAAWVQSPSAEIVQLATLKIAPKVVATRTYSDASAELQSLIENWTDNNAGTYRVAVRERGGLGREVSVGASTPTVMASTYKVFLSVVAYALIENGELAPSTVIDSGKSVEACIEGGIVDSENTCMVALGWHIGWDKVDDVLHDMGFRNMTLNNYASDGSYTGDKVAPAEEQAKLLMQLADGSLINQAHTESLLSYMKSQVYRSGIPAGSAGSVVANKVGFLYGYIHDMGIVYGPSSTYALVILSDGSDWDAIRDLASEISEGMK